MSENIRMNWKQACRLLGCSKTHFYRLVNTGELPSERYGKVKGVIVKKADCEDYMRKWKERIADPFH